MYTLTGKSLTPKILHSIGHNYDAKIKINDDIISNLHHMRNLLNTAIESGDILYGINTGFGSLSKNVISSANVDLLQLNLIRSHSVGCGEPIPLHLARMMMV